MMIKTMVPMSPNVLFLRRQGTRQHTLPTAPLAYVAAAPGPLCVSLLCATRCAASAAGAAGAPFSPPSLLPLPSSSLAPLLCGTPPPGRSTRSPSVLTHPLTLHEHSSFLQTRFAFPQAPPPPPIMSTPFLKALEQRRSIYSLGSKLPKSKKEVTETIKTAIRDCPSSFNVQSSRAVILYGAEHAKVWEIVKAALKKVMSAEQYAASEAKVNGCFLAGAGTVLFYEDTAAVKGQQAAFPLYAANFPTWSQHSSAIAQFAVWTALAQDGIGASLQHYNELIEAELRTAFGVPAEWQLVAQMPFGSIEKPAETYVAAEERLPYAAVVSRHAVQGNRGPSSQGRIALGNAVPSARVLSQLPVEIEGRTVLLRPSSQIFFYPRRSLSLSERSPSMPTHRSSQAQRADSPSRAPPASDEADVHQRKRRKIDASANPAVHRTADRDSSEELIAEAPLAGQVELMREMDGMVDVVVHTSQPNSVFGGSKMYRVTPDMIVDVSP